VLRERQTKAGRGGSERFVRARPRSFWTQEVGRNGRGMGRPSGSVLRGGVLFRAPHASAPAPAPAPALSGSRSPRPAPALRLSALPPPPPLPPPPRPLLFSQWWLQSLLQPVHRAPPTEASLDPRSSHLRAAPPPVHTSRCHTGWPRRSARLRPPPPRRVLPAPCCACCLSRLARPLHLHLPHHPVQPRSRSPRPCSAVRLLRDAARVRAASLFASTGLGPNAPVSAPPAAAPWATESG
jgi:hypothetical protein